MLWCSRLCVFQTICTKRVLTRLLRQIEIRISQHITNNTIQSTSTGAESDCFFCNCTSTNCCQLQFGVLCTEQLLMMFEYGLLRLRDDSSNILYSECIQVSHCRDTSHEFWNHSELQEVMCLRALRQPYKCTRKHHHDVASRYIKSSTPGLLPCLKLNTSFDMMFNSVA